MSRFRTPGTAVCVGSRLDVVRRAGMQMGASRASDEAVQRLLKERGLAAWERPNWSVEDPAWSWPKYEEWSECEKRSLLSLREEGDEYEVEKYMDRTPSFAHDGKWYVSDGEPYSLIALVEKYERAIDRMREERYDERRAASSPPEPKKLSSDEILVALFGKRWKKSPSLPVYASTYEGEEDRFEEALDKAQTTKANARKNWVEDLLARDKDPLKTPIPPELR